MLLLTSLLLMTLPKGDVPPVLQPWESWVLHGEERALCPSILVTDGRLCAFTGRLELKLDDKGGTFEQTFHVYGKEQWLPLPGDQKRWPQSVKVDGTEAIVAPRNEDAAGAAAVLLAAGPHKVTGAFEWAELPEALFVPPETGLLEMTVRGKAIGFPTREADGRVFLQKESTTTTQENLEIRVYRLVADDVPLTVTTRIELSVSGKGRELLLGPVLPDAFVPMALTSSVPARVEPDGRLRLQVRAGDFWVELLSRHEGPVTALKRPTVAPPWTEVEIWAFDARPHLRQVLIENVTAVDPQQTTLPAGWKRLPCYAMAASDEMKLTERRRGDSDPAPDQLALTRTLWLDFDGAGYTVNDRVSGSLHKSWRLDMMPGTELGRVTASGADQLVSRLKESTPEGVELREGLIALEAVSRIPHVPDGEVPAVSWDADFHQVSATLNLPPGWRLLHAGGVDQVSSTWVHDWTLLDIFLVLVISFAVSRLFGWRFGALSLLALVLLFREDGAPHFVWLFALAVEALLRVLPEHWFKTAVKVARFAVWVVLALISIVFAVEHVRHGMYPALERNQQLGGVQDYSSYSSENAQQLARSMNNFAQSEGNYGGNTRNDEYTVVVDGKTAAAPNGAPPAQAQAQTKGWGVQKGGKTRSYNPQDYDKSAVVQTGPGVPRWEWAPVTLGFSGPVDRVQKMSLWLVPPSVNLVLAFLRVLLLAVLVLCFFGFPGSFWPKGLKPSPKAAGLALPLVLAALLFAPSVARAQKMPDESTPDDTVLAELKKRLLERPECVPNCASSPRLFLDATPTTLKLRIELNAADLVAVPLPADPEQWMPRTVLVDGKPATALMRESGHLLVAVEKGNHDLVLEGPLPARETVQLPLPLKSHRVQAKLEGWTLDGLHEDGLADDTLQLTRKATGEKAPQALQSTNLPAFVSIERELVLGLRWTVVTTVHRLTPAGTAVVLEVPLLEGESVITQDVRVQGGRALVNMGPQVGEFSWASTLEEKPFIALEAPKGLPWTEVWRLDLSPVWHAELSGIPFVHQQDSAGARLPEWRPWPEEKVRIDASRPEGVKGQTLTIDQSELQLSPGLRATDATLTANLRSSHGGQHVIILPADASLQSVTINGLVQPIRQEGRNVSIPLVPGSQSVVLQWRQSSGLTTAWTTPDVNLGTPSANADLKVQLANDRWVLLAFGPHVGPAVLFWSTLLVLLLVSIGLGRIKLTPLGTLQWVLLMLGLSQVPVPAAAVVVGWLLALAWREKNPNLSAGWFDLRQLVLAGWALGAAGVLMAAIYSGLLGHPEMQIEGNGSSEYLLRWFQDRTTGPFPHGWVLSVPMLVYRGFMLSWSLWLALALLKWIRWSWTAFSAGGLWKSSPRAPAAPPPPSIKPVI